MNVRALTMLSLAAVAACSGAKASGAHAAAGAPAVAHVGQLSPQWNEPTTSGGMLSIESLRGKAVYLNFFASWCPPCNEEAPSVEALQRSLGSRGLQVVGVDELENLGKASDFVRAHHLSFPAVVDGGDLRDAYNVNGLPVHVFIDRAGIVRNIVVGELSPQEMRSNALALLR